MRSVTYSMGVSLDGYIVGPDGGFGWTAPDEEVFSFVTDEIRQVSVHLLGRRLYETMLYWETADSDPSLGDSMLEWAALWKVLPKVVFSTTLPAVQGHARLASGGLAEEIERSPRPAPSARESSTSATAWRASRLARRALPATRPTWPVTSQRPWPADRYEPSWSSMPRVPSSRPAALSSPSK
jgi:hypothetical protein